MLAFSTTKPTSWHAATKRRFTSSAGSRPALDMAFLPVFATFHYKQLAQTAVAEIKGVTQIVNEVEVDAAP